MRSRKNQRLLLVTVAVGLVGAATALTLTALDENIAFFAGPSELNAGELEPGQRLRLGGLVVEDSVVREDDGHVSFQLTDQAATIDVNYRGILPDLFREGQGIVAVGMLTANGRFQADEVLAKHDENYMPPEVTEALDRAGQLNHAGGGEAQP
ncbi:MAG: cytochrome c maturation protein CcmE [Alphaproteobacteria bacterium]